MAEYVITNRGDGLGARVVHLVIAARMAHVYGLKHLCCWTEKPNHCRVPMRRVVCPNRLIQPLNPARNHGEDEIERLFGDSVYRIVNPLPGVNVEDIKETAIYCKFPVMWPWRFPNEELKTWRSELSYVANNLIEWNYHVWKAADDFCQEHDLSDKTAVHIRRGDIERPGAPHHCRFVSNNTYFQYIEDNNLTNSIALFAEGDQAIEEFEKQYGEVLRLKHQGQQYGRHAGAIEYAMIELLIMSRCKQIIAGKSNFNQAACLMGNIPLTILSDRGKATQYIKD